MSRRTRAPLYMAWINMRRWCGYIGSATPKQRAYYQGVAVCREWRESYAEFSRWALAHGWQAGMAIVRIDKRCDYCPENCVVVTRAKANDMRSVVRRLADGRTTRAVVGPGATRLEHARAARRMFEGNWDPDSARGLPPLSLFESGIRSYYSGNSCLRHAPNTNTNMERKIA